MISIIGLPYNFLPALCCLSCLWGASIAVAYLITLVASFFKMTFWIGKVNTKKQHKKFKNNFITDY